ncbi:hypothetical protein N8482_00535 [Chitinophagales bacterium]|nr:hypothetical protein [Chitinophagales bacterium]
MDPIFLIFIFAAGIIIIAGVLISLVSIYKKVPQGEVIVKTGAGGTKVITTGGFVYPFLHKMEIMDIRVKKIEIVRLAKDGLICKDNMRADIKVAFFLRVNEDEEDIKKVASTIGCERASDIETLNTLFEAKFSEALKTVGKRFDFVELYDSREKFKLEIIDVIGTDLNGYRLDDCAIDYLEQTPLVSLKKDNILDAEGIKKITELTAAQNMKANLIRRDEEKTIKKQDVEAREAILELEKQLAEQEEKQKREIANIRSREEAQIAKVGEEERLLSETARIDSEEKIRIASENMERQVMVATKNKERTEAVETERVEKDRLLEVTERDRIVTLAEIEKEKAIEQEKKIIQEVIRERVSVEKGVVEEQEKIKDLQAFKEADRQKSVAITKAEELAEESLVQTIKAAEASRTASEFQAKQRIIEAEASEQAATKEAEAIKIMADAEAKKFAAQGLSEAQVREAMAQALQIEGDAQASVIEAKAEAEAKGIEAKSIAQSQANQKLGLAEAVVIEAKAQAYREQGIKEAEVVEALAHAEAQGIQEKAEAMKKLDGVGRDHEEFKLRLDKDKEVELEHIRTHERIADAQASVLSEALKSANIDIVGGEETFFKNIMGAIGQGKQIDALVNNSQNLTDLKQSLIGAGNGEIIENIKALIAKVGLSSNDIKNLSLSSFILNLQDEVQGKDELGLLGKIRTAAGKLGLENQLLKDIL